MLSDEQHHIVGSVHAAEGGFTARRTGAAFVSENIASLLREEPLRSLGGSSRVLVHCARGGQRSQSLGIVLSRVGWRVAVVSEGYKTRTLHGGNATR